METLMYENIYFEDIYNVVHNTIEEIYPKYYPRKAVDFFHNHHSKENMLENLPKEYTKIIMENSKIIGTGSAKENEIGRFFILPEYQNKGYGKLLLKELETVIIRKEYNNIILASSLGAVFFIKIMVINITNIK
jgi:GNAT superfamily N-acetyltransferase